MVVEVEVVFAVRIEAVEEAAVVEAANNYQTVLVSAVAVVIVQMAALRQLGCLTAKLKDYQIKFFSSFKIAKITYKFC